MPDRPPTAPRAVTLADIAARLAVHRTTVHRALNGYGRITAALRQRIVETAAELGYDPDLNPAARRLSLARHGRSPSNHAVALVMPRVFYRTSYFLRLFQGAMDVLIAADHSIHCFTYDAGDQSRLAGGIARAAVDGALALSHTDTLEPLATLLRELPGFAGKPVVSLINPARGLPHVTADYRRGGELLAGHLLDLGHRHLLHFALPGPGDGPMPAQLADRVAGMEDACRARGLDPRARLRGVGFDHAPGRDGAVLAAALARWPRTTALIASHDLMALRFIELLAASGRRVPDDLSVIGFDDSEPQLAASAAGLTTVAVPLEDIAGAATRLLLDRIAGRKGRRPAPHPVRLVIRRTTAPPRA